MFSERKEQAFTGCLSKIIDVQEDKNPSVECPRFPEGKDINMYTEKDGNLNLSRVSKALGCTSCFLSNNDIAFQAVPIDTIDTRTGVAKIITRYRYYPVKDPFES